MSMPCYTERTVSVALNVADEGVLTRALTALGYTDISRAADRLTALTPTGKLVTIRAGQVEMTGEYMTRSLVEKISADIHQAYGREAVQTAAKRYGFTVTRDKQDANHFTLGRRGF